MTPDAQRHRDKANEAWDAYQTLVGGGQYVWAVVALAYSALHHVDTYISDRGLHVGSHRTRGRIIASTSELTPIASNYDELFGRGLSARYDTGISYSSAEVQALEQSHYQPIRALILRLVP